MLLLLLVACQYSLHNNIVIMCVMYKQTRNTARCRHMVRYICRVMCTVNSMHGICTGACSHSCIRSAHARSMQWTPLLVQSKRVSTPNEMWATPKVQEYAGQGPEQAPVTTHTPLAMSLIAHVAAMPLWLVGCSPLSENHVPITLSILHWLNTFCCTRHLGTFLFPLGYQSSHLPTAEMDRERHLLRMDKISRLTELTFFSWPRQLDTVSHPLAALKSIYAFSLTFLTISWIAICRKWVPTPNLTQSSSSRSAGECPIARTTTYVSTVRITNLHKVLVVHNAQRGVECAYLPPHGNIVGDTRHPLRHSVWRR